MLTHSRNDPFGHESKPFSFQAAKRWPHRIMGKHCKFAGDRVPTDEMPSVFADGDEDPPATLARSLRAWHRRYNTAATASNSLRSARIVPKIGRAKLKATGSRLDIAVLAKPLVTHLDSAGRSAFLAHVLRHGPARGFRRRPWILRRVIHLQ
jgi:hypothetical protein